MPTASDLRKKFYSPGTPIKMHASGRGGNNVHVMNPKMDMGRQGGNLVRGSGYPGTAAAGRGVPRTVQRASGPISPNYRHNKEPSLMDKAMEIANSMPTGPGSFKGKAGKARAQSRAIQKAEMLFGALSGLAGTQMQQQGATNRTRMSEMGSNRRQGISEAGQNTRAAGRDATLLESNRVNAEGRQLSLAQKQLQHQEKMREDAINAIVRTGERTREEAQDEYNLSQVTDEQKAEFERRRLAGLGGEDNEPDVAKEEETNTGPPKKWSIPYLGNKLLRGNKGNMGT